MTGSPQRAELAARLRPALLDAASTPGRRVHGTTSGVLLPIAPGPGGEPTLMFTRRRDDLRRHPGEISFPGGRRDPDDSDVIATALREAHEETGLDPRDVELVGALTPIPTIATGYAIYPFVGVVDGGRAWMPQELEVAEVIEVPLAELAARYERRRMRRRGLTFTTNAFPLDDQRLIWGATGRITLELLQRLGLR